MASSGLVKERKDSAGNDDTASMIKRVSKYSHKRKGMPAVGMRARCVCHFSKQHAHTMSATAISNADY